MSVALLDVTFLRGPSIHRAGYRMRKSTIARLMALPLYVTVLRACASQLDAMFANG